MADTLYVLTHNTLDLAKIWKADGTIVPSANAKYFDYDTYTVGNISEFSTLLTSLEEKRQSCLIRGRYKGNDHARHVDPDYQEGKVRRILDVFDDQPLHSVMIEVDDFEPEFFDPVKEPMEAIQEYIEDMLPECFQGKTFHWQLSSSAGKKGKEHILKVHLWFWLKTPQTSAELKQWATSTSLASDHSVFNPVQIHFTANPIFEEGVVDPVIQRSGLIEGENGDEVELVMDTSSFSAEIVPSRLQVLSDTLKNDPVAVFLNENGYVKSIASDGKMNIICPFSDSHSVESNETSTVYYPPHTGGYQGGGFKCMHQSCSGRTKHDYLEKLGIQLPKVFNPNNQTGIARSLMEDRFQVSGVNTLIRNMGDWFHYRSTSYHTRVDEGVRAEIRTYLDHSVKEGKEGQVIPFHPKMTDISGVMDALTTKTLLETSSPPVWLDDPAKEATDYVSFKNGILHIPTRRLLPHTPHFFTLNSLPYDYVEEGKPTKWLEFLDQIFDGDRETINTLQEIFGYMITPITSFQKMVMLLGPKRSGKGTVARVITAMLGSSNVCSSNLSSLSGNFGLQPFLGKLLGIFPDVRVSGQSDIKTIIGNLLSISGEDNIIVDRKYKEPWSGKLTSRMFLISNEIPQLMDANDALSSRFIYLSTRKSFYAKEDPDLTTKLLEELPYIFLWSLEGRTRLLQRGYFIQPSSSKNLLEESKRLSNPLLSFIEDCCDIGESYYVEKGKLYQSYQWWCQDNGHKSPKTIAVFARDLRSADDMIDSDRKVLGEDKKRVYVFTGVRLTPREEVIDELSDL